MKLKVLEEKDNELTIEITGEEHSFPALLAWALLKDPNVEFAVYDKEHPLLGHAKLYVKTRKSTPWHALEKSINTIESEFSDILKITEKMAKSEKKKKK